MNFKKLTITLLITSYFMLFSQVGMAKDSEPVGKLMFTIGKVIIVKASGKEKRARRGAKVFEGDLIKTDKKGQAQIKFKDGARISVRSNSEFKIDAYAYNADTDKSNYKSELSLLKGGIRSITGAIGKSNKKSYKMKTVVATIGIRGTDYSLMLCNQDCAGVDGNVSNGLYVGVVNGGITLQNDAGSMDVSPNQYAMVGSSRSMPKMLPKAPSFLMFDKTTASKSERTKVAKAFAQRKSSAKKNGSRSQQTSTSGSKQRQSNQQLASNQNKKDSGTSSSTTTEATGISSNEESNTETSNTEESNAVTNAETSTETVAADDSTSSTPLESTMESIIDDRYAESSDVSVPDVIVEATPELVLDADTFTTESVDAQVAENIEPDEEVLLADEETQIAVGIASDTTTADQGITTTTGDITTDPTTTTDPTITGSTTTTPLPANGLTRFFNFIFGSSDLQSETEITLLDTTKVKTIYQVDSTDADRTSYIEYSLDSAKLYDFGHDPDTGLSWGRWSSGNMSQITTTPDGQTTSSIDMTNQSLHWITGVEGSDTVTLPITGVRNFVLIGNTNPTDNFGNVGILGSASLTADFDAKTVDADVSVSINQQIWEGYNADIPLTMDNGKFSTEALTVDVIGGTNTGGSISGGLIDGVTNGGGFTYSMDATINGEVNQVNGAAAFKEVP